MLPLGMCLVAGIQHRHAGKLSLNHRVAFSIQANVYRELRYIDSYAVSSTLTVSKAFNMARVNSPVDAVP